MEEMLDIFDINGNHLGVRTRSYCHSDEARRGGEFHKAVWIWIKNSKGKLLVQKRAKFKKVHPNKWAAPSAGHVDAGESCIDTCVRETKEELGLNVKKEDFIFLREWVNKEGMELAQTYLLIVDIEEKDIVLQKEEVSEVKWLKYDEFVKLIYSDEFCVGQKSYIDWIVEALK